VPALLSFPPTPPALKGRAAELDRLARRIEREHPSLLSLVGPGGSGKSTLAAALGHKVAHRFPGGIHWFRVGAWSTTTLHTMLAIRLGTPRGRLVAGLKRWFLAHEATFIVLDNHEDDEATAQLLNSLAGVPVSWVITARRCLLSGVTVYPVNPPLALKGDAPYRSVASLTALLRHNPLALSIADALVRDEVVMPASLERTLLQGGAARIMVIADEDDLPEVRLLVDFVWRRLPEAGRRTLGVLAHTAGDHVDRASLLALARVGAGETVELDRLLRWRLIQEPFADRYALHATVRRAVVPRIDANGAALFEHYVGLLEGDPERLDAEQTHLFAAMDHAQEHGSLQDRLRLASLLRRLGL
jgi:hypothetical protein